MDNLYVIKSLCDDDTIDIKNAPLIPFESKNFDRDVICLKGTESTGKPLPNQNYDGFFVYCPAEFRYRILEDIIGNNGDVKRLVGIISSCVPSKQYERVAIELQSYLCHYFASAKVFCNLSFGDLVVLLPSSENNDMEKMKFVVADFIQSKQASALYVKDTPPEAIISRREDIFNRLKNQYLYRRNANYGHYERIIIKLLNLKVGSLDRKMECVLLANLLLRTMLDESALRWIYKSGDIHYEDDPAMTEELDLSFDILESNFSKFMSQANVFDSYSDQIWQLIFVARALLASMLGRGENAARDKKIDVAYHNNFYGFIPVISSKYEEVTSYYPIHLSPDYSYGFLYIPENNKYEFWSYFPAYVHEFFHHVPPRNRKERNGAILKLTVFGVTNPILKSLRGKDKSKYNKFVDNITEKIEIFYKNLIDHSNEFIFNNQAHGVQVTQDDIYKMDDTMSFSDVMRELIPLIDFNDLYDTEYSALFSDALEDVEERAAFKLSKKDCTDKWNFEALDLLMVFTTALREIRSDISMCEFLDIDLESYIKILALEPNFAFSSVDKVAPSTVLRFGFMTRYLHHKKKYNSTVLTSALKADIDCWREDCMGIISDLEKNEDLKNPENLKNYLYEYENITVDKNFFDGDKCDFAYVLFEEIFFSSQNGNDSIILSWEKDLKKYSMHPLVETLRILHGKYFDIKTDKDKVLFDYNTRLVFRDLLAAFPNVDMDNE